MLHLLVFMLVSVYLKSLPLSHPSQMSLDLLYLDAGGAWHLGSESWHYHFLTVPPWASDSSSVRWEQQDFTSVESRANYRMWAQVKSV